MKIRINIALAFLLSATILFAQNEEEYSLNRPRNNIYVSAFGVDFSMLSVNYERLFLIKPIFFFTGEIGLGYNKAIVSGNSSGDMNIGFGIDKLTGNYLTIPHHLTMNLGKGKSFFEFGMGGTAIIGSGNTKYYLYPLFGYRLYPLKSKKVNFRVSTTIPINKYIDHMWLPFGISLGMGF